MPELFDTPLEPPVLQRNTDDYAYCNEIAGSDRDKPVLMLNMNRYRADCGYPDKGLYKQYIEGLGPFLDGAGGGRILWRMPVLGKAVGDVVVSEILACWYPSHKVFVGLYDAPGAEENFRLKGLCVQYAMIHRCPGDQPPFAPFVGCFP